MRNLLERFNTIKTSQQMPGKLGKKIYDGKKRSFFHQLPQVEKPILKVSNDGGTILPF